jgi:hypothetical protein
MKQSKERKEEILRSLPEGVRRVQVVSEDGKQQYKRPDEINLEKDEIMLSSDGSPIVMKGKPGRKPKAVLKPVSPAAALLCQARAEHLGADRLLETVSTDSESEKVIEGILSALAEDAAVIDFEKEEAFRNGQEASNLAGKRARILKGMSDIWLRKRSLMEGGVIDLDSPMFKELFSLLLETFREVLFQSGVTEEHVETIFAKLISSFDDVWKEDARRRMRQASK